MWCFVWLWTVTSFKYLGSVITDEGSKPEILFGIAQATAALTRLKPVWNDGSISVSSKIQLTRSLVTSIFLYACESWTLTAELRRRIQAIEMRCYHKILRISYKDHVTNENIHSKIQQAIGPHKDLLTIIKRCKLRWYGHVSRSSGKGEEDKADRGRGGKTTSGNGQAWSLPSPRGQWRTGTNGENWLWNHLWCPNDPRSQGIDDDEVDHLLIIQPLLTAIPYATFDYTKLMGLNVDITHSSISCV